MYGTEIAKSARERRLDLPIAFASGYADTAAIEDVAGSDALVLRKPFRIYDLQAVLTEALISRSALGSPCRSWSIKSAYGSLQIPGSAAW